jgi:hypothetical protein
MHLTTKMIKQLIREELSRIVEEVEFADSRAEQEDAYGTSMRGSYAKDAEKQKWADATKMIEQANQKSGKWPQGDSKKLMAGMDNQIIEKLVSIQRDYWNFWMEDQSNARAQVNRLFDMTSKKLGASKRYFLPQTAAFLGNVMKNSGPGFDPSDWKQNLARFEE